MSDNSGYRRLKVPVFKAEVKRQREQVIQEALGVHSPDLTEAVETLAGLLDGRDKRSSGSPLVSVGRG
jgi:hypothetical protein